MATMSLKVFANEIGNSSRERMSSVQEGSNFRIVDKVENAYEPIDYMDGNIENNSPPYVDGEGCCSYMQGRDYR